MFSEVQCCCNKENELKKANVNGKKWSNSSKKCDYEVIMEIGRNRFKGYLENKMDRRYGVGGRKCQR
jgi:hypothetical protein